MHGWVKDSIQCMKFVSLILSILQYNDLYFFPFHVHCFRQAFHKEWRPSPTDMQRAFYIPAYVLRGMMQGQFWPDGDSNYHASLSVAVLIIHGCQDEFVTREESMLMQEVIHIILFTISIGN